MQLKCYRCAAWPCVCKDRQTIIHGDCREVLPLLPDESVHCCVTSPPYWGLRDYGVGEQLGLEATPDEYVAKTPSFRPANSDLTHLAIWQGSRYHCRERGLHHKVLYQTNMEISLWSRIAR